MTYDLSHLAEIFAQEVSAGERGAICVMHQGRVLLNLNGGDAALGEPWQDDTLACCFSVSKGVLSILAHVMIDRRMITLETPIASVWPEFGQNGKDKITLLDVLTHRAGLPAVSHPVAAGDLYDWDRMTQHLARSALVLPAQSAPAYHNMTYGHLLGETLCRAASEPSLPRLLHQLVTAPLGGDFRIGPQTSESIHLAHITQENPGALFCSLRDAPDTLFARSMAFFDPTEDFNSSRWRNAVIGSGSGHATAKALAILYGQLIWENALLTPARQKAARRLHAETSHDPILGIPIRLGQGLELSTPPGLDFGPNPATIGHWGAGGAQALADPHHGIAFGYVTGHMADGMGSSSRAARLVAALYSCLNRNQK